MTHAIDLRGLVRPQLVESTKREDHPNVATLRSNLAMILKDLGDLAGAKRETAA